MVSVLVLGVSSHAVAQAAPAAVTPKSLGLFVYPARQQDAAQQAKDEGECVAWAESQSGIDPTAAPADRDSAGRAAAARADSATRGARVAGAAGGAARGAVIGAIAGDAGTGAAIGAAGGAMGGGSARRGARRQADAAGRQQAAAQDQQRLATLKRAVSTCLQGRGYTVN
jgi:uncharacterized protein YcfJ